MWIQVRSMDGKKSIRVDGLSKLTKIDDLRQKLIEPFDAPPERQRLFYRGKQLVDGHTLYDYDMTQNGIIQIMVRSVLQPITTTVTSTVTKDEDVEDKENIAPSASSSSDSQNNGLVDDTGATYKIGDLIDARDPTMGAWFEGKIVKLEPMTAKTVDSQSNEPTSQSTTSEDNSESSNGTKTSSDNSENDAMKTDENQNQKDSKVKSESEMDTSALKEKPIDDGFRYSIVFEGYEEDENTEVLLKDIRPRARETIKFKNAEVGEKVMINYNYDEPEERGYWYDAIITNKRDTRTVKELFGTIFLGPDLTPLENCKIVFIDEVMKIEDSSDHVVNMKDVESGVQQTPTKRKNKPNCDECQDNPRRKCKFCSCSTCGGKSDPEKQILCDECDQAFHIFCLDPPLTDIPEEDEWYCPLCKNDENEVVKAGEKLKASKKKAKMASATSKTGRDWGKGMACVGRTKMCSIVPPNHFGPIPGIEVGTLWKYRVQVSEAGVHRPHVAGIHGREEDGAYSIVLSGGYEDDHDDGEEFTYTGSGGRDLSGNKRTAEQSCDQLLTRMNKALAKTCNAPLDNKNGSESKDWKGGKPIRVVRNCKGRKHSKFAPEDGNRYDGIYKVVKYWPAKGKSGFIVWRYLLRRDDPIPAPWTKAGKKKIEQLGLEMQYPEGYLEAQKEKEEKESKGKGKRSKKQSDGENSDTAPETPPAKKAKLAAFKVPEEIEKLIEEDVQNKKLWDDAMEHVNEGAQKFHAYVEELFACICCQDIVFKPITTKCNHNICKQCMVRSFKAEVFSCPCCRTELGKDYSLATNKTLIQILNSMYPGYENGR
ncbi:E3 ubiquitin-protein ligase UHRF1-like [Tubulanus polymorphus]|uniref:E3 ubiquitin-protein ligase UHRF1-like n=1 Tax=Tubulanus polymorphus TaxID=672921 RepID=UPI003DA53723